MTGLRQADRVRSLWMTSFSECRLFRCCPAVPRIGEVLLTFGKKVTMQVWCRSQYLELIHLHCEAR